MTTTLKEPPGADETPSAAGNIQIAMTRIGTACRAFIAMEVVPAVSV